MVLERNEWIQEPLGLEKEVKTTYMVVVGWMEGMRGQGHSRCLGWRCPAGQPSKNCRVKEPHPDFRGYSPDSTQDQENHEMDSINGIVIK